MARDPGVDEELVLVEQIQPVQLGRELAAIVARRSENLSITVLWATIDRMHGAAIVAKTLSATAIVDAFGNSWQYHSRSDRHSKAACWGILFDLLQHSRVLADHVRSNQVAFGINHQMVDFKNNRKKNLDLVLCEPGPPKGRGRKPHTFASLVGEYGIVLSSEEKALLQQLPALTEAPVGSVRVALEAKAAMTAHVKALPRLYDELNSSHSTVHGATDLAIAAGFVMANLADTFISPDMNRVDLKTTPARVSKHKQPADCERVITKAREIPRRTTTNESGFDALAIVVVDCKNDGSAVKLIEKPPAPPTNDIFHYDQMVRRVAQIYEYRFGRI